MTSKTISLVQDLQKRFGLTGQPIRSDVVAKRLGIEVVTSEFTPGLNGVRYDLLTAAVSSVDASSIRVSKMQTLEEQNYACAIEMGHILLDPKFISSSKYRGTLKDFTPFYEQEAAAMHFARHLLLPDVDALKDIRGRSFAAKAAMVPDILVHDRLADVGHDCFTIQDIRDAMQIVKTTLVSLSERRSSIRESSQFKMSPYAERKILMGQTQSDLSHLDRISRLYEDMLLTSEEGDVFRFEENHIFDHRRIFEISKSYQDRHDFLEPIKQRSPEEAPAPSPALEP